MPQILGKQCTIAFLLQQKHVLIDTRRIHSFHRGNLNHVGLICAIVFFPQSNSDWTCGVRKVNPAA